MKTWIAVVLAAALGLAACDKPSEEVAPAPKKSLARQAQFYAGQEQVASLDSGAVEKDPAGGLKLTAAGKVPMAGYTDAGFKPRVYAGPPTDGIYEVDVVATKPAAPGAAVETPIEIKGAWSGYNQDRLKGVKFISKTNEITAMLPAG
jgi:hypothetical protein